MQDDLRQRLSNLLLEHGDTISADTVAIFPYSGPEFMDTAYCSRLGRLLVQLLAFAVRDGRLDPRGGFLADLNIVVTERPLSIQQLFTFAYLTERTALDELALDEEVGATSEPWLVAQLVHARRSTCWPLTSSARSEPTEASITDRLTTRTRGRCSAVLDRKSSGRAGWSPDPLILSTSTTLNDQPAARGMASETGFSSASAFHPHHFRQHDWVARHWRIRSGLRHARPQENAAGPARQPAAPTTSAAGSPISHCDATSVTVTISAPSSTCRSLSARHDPDGNGRRRGLPRRAEHRGLKTASRLDERPRLNT